MSYIIKLFHQRSLNVYFILVNLIIFIITILLRFHSDTPYKTMITLMLVALECFSFFLLIKIFQDLKKQTEEEIKRETLYQQKKIQDEHLLAMMQADQDIEKLSKQLEILKNSSSDTIDPQFKEEMDNLFISYCPNKIVDAILYHKSFLMKKNHIRYLVKASVKEDLVLEDFAILSVLNNLIDNAMEACTAHNISKPYVDISIHTQANYLIVQVKNPISPEMTALPKKSTKKDRREHGLGLGIIEQQCKKHHGSFTVEINEKEHAITCTATLRLENE